MNKKFVCQVRNNKKSYMMDGQPNIKKNSASGWFYCKKSYGYIRSDLASGLNCYSD